MDHEWDDEKAEANYRKHWVQFADAVMVFDDDRAMVMLDDHLEEERYIIVGTDDYARVLVVVFTWRGDVARIISARKANRSERRQYERGER